MRVDAGTNAGGAWISRGMVVATKPGMTNGEKAKTRLVVLAAIDTSAAASIVVREASAIARVLPESELHLVHVVETIAVAAATVGGSPFALPSTAAMLKDAEEHLRRYLNEADKLADKRVIGHLRLGVPWKEIVQLATDLSADLLVVGTHDYHGLERLLLGSRTDTLVRSAPCAVLVARNKVEHRKDVPEIEPPCPECQKIQKETNGEKLWCERHAQHHPRAHKYGEAPEGFAQGSLTIRPGEGLRDLIGISETDAPRP